MTVRQTLIEITDLSHDGEGIGRSDGQAVFIPGAVPGDRLIVELVETARRHARGRIIKLIEPSAARAEPLCLGAGRCGGCQLQHIAYPDQVEFKGRILASALRRIGGLNVQPKPLIPAPSPWFYRTRVQLPISAGSAGPVAGYYARATHEIVVTRRCIIQHPAADDAVRTAVRLSSDLGWIPYEEKTHTGELRHIAARTAVPSGDTLVTLVTRTGRLDGIDSFVQRIADRHRHVRSVAVNINPNRTNVIYGSNTSVAAGPGYIEQEMNGIRYRIDPTSFFQVYPGQAARLHELAVDWAACGPGMTLIDVYAGVGPIALSAAVRGASVIAVERFGPAAAEGRRIAHKRGLDVSFVTGDAAEAMTRLQARGVRPDTVVFDPPRKGCERAVIDAACDMKPERIVYVSCNPGTLARDARLLVGRGYNIRAVQGLDMFPHTAHVECVALMSRVVN